MQSRQNCSAAGVSPDTPRPSVAGHRAGYDSSQPMDVAHDRFWKQLLPNAWMGASMEVAYGRIG